MTKLKYIADLLTVSATVTNRPLITLDKVRAGEGRLDEHALDSSDQDDLNLDGVLVEPGDVLFGKLRPYLAKVWLVDRPAIASSEFLALRCRSEIEPEWFAFVLASNQSVSWAVAHSDGAKMPRTSWDKFGQFRVDVPPLSSQKRIAASVRTEVARMRRVRDDSARLFSLLQERIDCRVMELVGRSPLGGGSRVPLVPIRRLLSRRLELHTPIDDAAIVTAFRDGTVTLRSVRGREGFTNTTSADATMLRVRAGDVVVHGLDGFSGAIGDAEADGFCSPAYHVCTVQEGDAAFQARLLRLLALDGYLGNHAISTRERAVDFRNWDLFGRIRIPNVPSREQRAIGDEIRNLRPLKAKLEGLERLTLERTSALISDAVTEGCDERVVVT